ncbi:MAG: hypothetical protein MZW92_73250 [Comamonadaceae bacterium]|nr:hypothetical protein [Comamonadaceae bacterium]
MLPGRGRPGRDHRPRAAAADARAPTAAWPSGSSSACCRCAACRRPSRPRACAAALGRARRRRALPARQADRRRLPRRRQPAAGAARAGRSTPGSTPSCVAQRMMGYTDAPRRAERRRAGARWWRRRPARRGDAGPALPVLPRAPAAGRAATTLGAARRLAGRVEVRRHPRPARAARRPGCWIWSRGEELVDRALPRGRRRRGARCPTAPCSTASCWSWRAGEPRRRRSTLLQQRIGRKTLTKKLLADAPVVFVAYDLLESAAAPDRRGAPQHERRAASAKRCWPGRDAAPVAARSTRADWAGAAPRCASSRARAASRASCSSSATRATAAAAPRPTAPGGSGRSSRCAVDCGARLRPGRPRPPRQRLHRLHLRGLEPRAGATPPRRRRWSRRSRGASRRGPARCSWCPSPRPTRA